MRTALGLTLVAALIATPLSALDIKEPVVRRADGWLWVDLRLDDLFPPRVEESLSRGMPARLQLHAELWRRRTAWFDRLETSVDGEFRVQFEAWERVYRLQRSGTAGASYATLDSIRKVLSRPLVVRLTRLDRLQHGARYYVAVSATLKPLSVEDVKQLEGWLSGEVDTKRSSGFGAITELPRSVFDAVRNFVGFGDERVRANSDDFSADRDADQ